METHKYDDIINLPHHVSKVHPQMSLLDRAAQFAPFAALSGHKEAVNETARFTDERLELDENEKDILNARLRLLAEHLSESPTAKITYFKSDDKKKGGAYLTAEGCVKKIDEYERCVKMTDGTAIPIEDIAGIDSDIFCLYF